MELQEDVREAMEGLEGTMSRFSILCVNRRHD